MIAQFAAPSGDETTLETGPGRSRMGAVKVGVIAAELEGPSTGVGRYLQGLLCYRGHRFAGRLPAYLNRRFFLLFAAGCVSDNLFKQRALKLASPAFGQIMNPRKEGHAHLRNNQISVMRNAVKVLLQLGGIVFVRIQQVRHGWIVLVMLQNL